MKVAIIGTVGVPANYGGFETLVENLLTFRSNKNIEYTVYCSAKRYDKKLKEYKGAKLKYLPLDANGKQALIYDSLSILDAIRDNDVILSLGASGSLVLPLIKPFINKKIIINLDGVDTSRAKFSPIVRKFLNIVRKTAAKYGTICISDNEGIRKYVKEAYGRDSVLIEYGGDNAFRVVDHGLIASKYGLSPKSYCFKVARIEAENNIEMILEAFSRIPAENMVIVGNWNKSDFGARMKEKYSGFTNLHLLDPIYDAQDLNLLRSNCKLYIHGHSVGGTNPSLVEAMNLGLPILAFDCIFNRETTENKARYFTDVDSLISLIKEFGSDQKTTSVIGKDMLEIAKRRYTWEIITSKYEVLYK